VSRAEQRRSAELVALRGGRDAPVSVGAPVGLGVAGVEAWEAALASAAWLQSDADLLVLRHFADLADERAELRALIAQHGRTTTGSQGQLVESPYVGQLHRVEASMLKTAAVLGLGPTNAARLGVPLPKPADRDDPDAPVAAAMAGYRRAVVSGA
jgi:P27 family predicted phage terminase small subunit